MIRPLPIATRSQARRVQRIEEHAGIAGQAPAVAAVEHLLAVWL